MWRLVERSYPTEAKFRRALRRAERAGTLIHWFGGDHGWIIVTREFKKSVRIYGR